ncbi:hypothetical protein EDD15DRAFT_2237775 [Pisolithus albus]|nr:hypothetical protein EDD15DRAFT_2295579 [Pisolithus albus]KAI5999612.1 hypothetical protein EDD15DRAFT_2237775 [Pisolithus albus]
MYVILWFLWPHLCSLGLHNTFNLLCDSLDVPYTIQLYTKVVHGMGIMILTCLISSYHHWLWWAMMPQYLVYSKIPLC